MTPARVRVPPPSLTEDALAVALSERTVAPEWLVVSPDLMLLALRIIDSRDTQTGEPKSLLYGAVNWKVDERMPRNTWKLIPGR